MIQIWLVARIDIDNGHLRDVTGDARSRFRYRTGHNHSDGRWQRSRWVRRNPLTRCPAPSAERWIWSGGFGKTLEGRRRLTAAQLVGSRPIRSPERHTLPYHGATIANNKAWPRQR